MPRKVRDVVVACPGTAKLVVGVIDAKGRPLYGVTVVARCDGKPELSSFTTGVRGPAVAQLGMVPAGRYLVAFRGAEGSGRTIDVQEHVEHSRNNPNVVLQWRVQARLLDATPAEIWPPAEDLDVRYRIDDPDGMVTAARIEILDRAGTVVHRADVAHAAGERTVAAVWDAAGATVERGPYVVRLVVLDPVQTHRSERTVRVREASLAVTVIDCFRHVPLRDADVVLGVEAEDDAELAADDRFVERQAGYDDTTFEIVRRAKTGRDGVAVLPQLEPYCNGILRVRVMARGYHDPEFVEREEVLVKPPKPETHERVTLEVPMVSEDPPIPPDLVGKVQALLAAAPGIRIVVEQGPNFGNQAAALALVRNLRRVGYTGPIVACADPVDTKYTARNQGTVYCYTTPDQTGATIVGLVRARLVHRYGAALTIEGEQSHDSGIGASGNLGGGTLTGRVRYPARTYFEEDLAQLAADLVALAHPVTVTLDGEDAVAGAVVKNDLVHTKTWQITLDLTFESLSETAVGTKLARLEPNYANADPQTTWRAAACFDTDADDGVLGIVAGGEFSKDSLQTLRAEAFRTQSLLALQPFWWHPSTRFVAVADAPVEPLCLPHAATYRQEPLALDVPARNALLLAAGGLGGAGLQAMRAAVAAGTLDLMVVYGVHQAHYSSTAVVMRNLAAAVRRGQALGSIQRAVMVVICKTSVTAHLPVDAGISTNTCDAGLAAAVGGLGAGRLLVVQPAGSLPSDAFQALCEASTLPMILEGANTANLMQMLGHPYLSVASKTTPYLKVPTDGADGHLRLAALERLLNESPLDVAGQTELGTYFGAARQPAAVLDGYFPKLQAYVRATARDQVLLGLYKLALALG